MAQHGFAPVVERRGDQADITLVACPSETTALIDPDTVCGFRGIRVEGNAAYAVTSSPSARAQRMCARRPCQPVARASPQGSSSGAEHVVEAPLDSTATRNSASVVNGRRSHDDNSISTTSPTCSMSSKNSANK